MLERAAEMTEHLGREKVDSGATIGATRNGKSPKTLKDEFGELTARDRKATFDPKIVAKGQTRWTASTTSSSRCTRVG
jgi:transposase-like protein